MYSQYILSFYDKRFWVLSFVDAMKSESLLLGFFKPRFRGAADV